MIVPVNIVTNNVAKELLRTAKKNVTSVSQLHIEILSVSSFVQEGDSDSYEILGNEYEDYRDEEVMRDNSVKFEQEYHIEIKSTYRGYPFEDMITEIEFDEHDTLAYFVIKKGSKLKYYDGLYNDFLNYIKEQKLRVNIMLILFDADYKQTIQEFVNVIEKVKTITFKEDKKILISEGFDAIESINSEICMNIEEKNDVGVEDSEGRIDYANRGFLLSCEEGEQLFEFIKPQQGEHGRTCRGDIIEVATVNLDVKPTFTVNNTIEVQDSFENIKYLSNRSGFLVKKGNQYDVSNTINVGEISFKTTGTINSNLDSEISINVLKDNPLEDAIEEGMHVKVQQLSIKGSVGPDVQIEAREISINGQTHHTSSIKCANAYISNHKGKVVCRKIEVDTLEGGEIVADTVVIKNAIRGKIKAKRIKIQILGTHVTMEASEYIEIESAKGEENRFIIDTSSNSGLDNIKEDDKIYLTKLKNELKVLSKNFKDAAEKVKNNLEQCEKVKAAIIKSKNAGEEISPNLIQNFKICKVMKVHYATLKEDVTNKKIQLEKLEKKLFVNSTTIFDAKIVVNEPLKGYNHIIYRLYNPEREIELRTNESMTKRIFKLIEDENGIVKIANIN